MDKKAIWRFLKHELEKKRNAVLLVVADSSESSPGRQGFLMAVNSQGETIGTVGGGMLEFKMIRKALTMFKEKRKSVLKILHHDADSEGEKSGLICGGTQSIVLTLLTKNEIEKINEIVNALENNVPRLVIITQNGIDVRETTENIEGTKFNVLENGGYKYSELIGAAETVYIVGGGHVGLALSKLMKFLNFRVVVFDDRKNVFTLKENNAADNKIITSYENVGRFIPEGDFSYIVVVTARHMGDKDALKSVIKKNVKYIGALGSKKKAETIFNALKEEGIDEPLLQKIHSPVGLSIASETPEEIAVSIAAEIIKVKNSR